MRDRVERTGRRLEPARPRPRLRHRHRPGLRHARPDRLRGALRLRGDRQRHEPRGPAVRRRPAPGRSWCRSACSPPTEDLAVGEPVGDLEPEGIQHAGSGATTSPALDQTKRGDADDRSADLESAGRHARPSPTSTTSARYRALRRAASARCRRSGTSMRLDLDDESVVVVPSVSLERTTAGSGTADAGISRSASCSCSCCCASRGCA